MHQDQSQNKTYNACWEQCSTIERQYLHAANRKQCYTTYAKANEYGSGIIHMKRHSYSSRKRWQQTTFSRHLTHQITTTRYVLWIAVAWESAVSCVRHRTMEKNALVYLSQRHSKTEQVGARHRRRCAA